MIILQITATTAQPVWQIDCVSCVGQKGGQCDTSPLAIKSTVQCNDTCITWRSLASSG